jgi:hypothetical protein
MKANMLIIDDEETLGFGFAGSLAFEGHEVITANAYLEALARMDEVRSRRFLVSRFMRNCTVFKDRFRDGDSWPVERLSNRSFWRVGNGREWVAYKTNEWGGAL